MFHDYFALRVHRGGETSHLSQKEEGSLSTANPQTPLEADVLCAGMRGYRDAVVSGVATSGCSHRSNVQLRYFPWTASFSLVSLSIHFSVSMN